MSARGARKNRVTIESRFVQDTKSIHISHEQGESECVHCACVSDQWTSKNTLKAHFRFYNINGKKELHKTHATVNIFVMGL